MSINIRELKLDYSADLILLLLLFFELFTIIFSLFTNLYFPSSSLYLFYLLTSVLFLNNKLLKKRIFNYYILITPLIIHGIFNDNSVFSVMSSSRIILFLPFVLMIKESKSITLQMILLLYVNTLLFANYLIGTKNLMEIFNIISYYQSRNITSLNGVPFGFETNFAGIEFIRSWSGFLAADKASYLALFSFSLIIYFLKICVSIRPFVFALSLLSSFFLLTEILFVKSCLLILLIVLFYRYIFALKNSHKFAYIVTINTVIVSLFLILKFAPAKDLSSSGAISHIKGLVTPIVNEVSLNKFLFGHGLGSGGTLGGNLRETNKANVDLNKYDLGGESTIGALFFQIGCIGLLYLFIIIYTVIRPFVDDSGYLILLSIFISCFFSEAVTSIVSLVAISGFIRNLGLFK